MTFLITFLEIYYAQNLNKKVYKDFHRPKVRQTIFINNLLIFK